MSTKSKTAMETNEAETATKVRPSRNMKPVSYNENIISKRGPASSAKESSSEPKDKKKKKVNGSSNDDAPTKKSGKKKAEDSNEDEDELMPESRKQPVESKPVDEKAKKPIGRKKKVEATAVTDAAEEDPTDDKLTPEPDTKKESKTTAQRKGRGPVEVANGEGSSKPIESEAASSKTAAKGKKTKIESQSVATKAVKGKKGAKETKDAEVTSDGPEEEDNDVAAKPVVPKQVPSKTTKGKKGVKASNGADAESDGQNSEDGEMPAKPTASKPVTSKAAKGKKPVKESNDAEAESDGQNSDGEVPAKPTASKPVTSKAAKGKKPVKESNDEIDQIEDTEETSSKAARGRGKKAAPKEPPAKATKRKAEPSNPSVIKAKVAKTTKTTVNLPAKLKTDDDDFKSPAGEWTFKISSWNVAGLRALVKKNGFDYIKAENPDIFCLQETKCVEDEIPVEANIEGYHRYWLGFKGGRAGVALYTKIMPYELIYGINDPQMDDEARVITAEYTKFYLLCVYVPNSGRKLVNLDKRMKWDALFQDYITELNKKKPVIVCGDMNVAHLEIDLANPKSNKRNAGFTDEERLGMSNMLAKGFVDTYRHLYPDKTKAYTFWTYMSNARAENVGWRLDYFIVSERLQRNVVDSVMRTSVLGSDHCPIVLFLKF